MCLSAVQCTSLSSQQYTVPLSSTLYLSAVKCTSQQYSLPLFFPLSIFLRRASGGSQQSSLSPLEGLRVLDLSRKGRVRQIFVKLRQLFDLCEKSGIETLRCELCIVRSLGQLRCTALCRFLSRFRQSWAFGVCGSLVKVERLLSDQNNNKIKLLLGLFN